MGGPRVGYRNGADLVVEAYASGREPVDIATEFGIHWGTVYQRLRRAGVEPRNIRTRPNLKRRKPVPEGEIIAAFQAGASVKALAARFGVARSGIALRLREAGVRTRSRGESMLVRMAQATPEERQQLTAAAHDAVRGRRVPYAQRRRIAKGRERLQSQVTVNERRLCAMLERRGLTPVPQQAVGPYNLDLGLWPVDVEIFGGHWHWYGRHAARTPKRFRSLMRRGWSVLAVNLTTGAELTDATADLVAAFVADVERRGEPRYRVVRADGYLLAEGTAATGFQGIGRPKPVPARRSG